MLAGAGRAFRNLALLDQTYIRFFDFLCISGSLAIFEGFSWSGSAKIEFSEANSSIYQLSKPIFMSRELKTLILLHQES